jgi:cobalt-zinc-cadmium efflux system protein
VAFVAIEAVYGIIANSMALLADAGHNLSDVLGLMVAWVASMLSSRPPSTRYTYGLGHSSILAALFNAVVLLIAIGGIAWEALRRLFEPAPVAETTVMVVAAIGILVNGATAMLFASGRRGDLNIRGAFLHMITDAAVSAGVVVAGVAILVTGWLWVDPLVSLAIVVVIAWSSWGLLRDSLALSLAGVPAEISADQVARYLSERDGVASVHDLHIWALSTTRVALTCHLVVPQAHPGNAFLAEVAHDLRTRFGIDHPTIQIETMPGLGCAETGPESAWRCTAPMR